MIKGKKRPGEATPPPGKGKGAKKMKTQLTEQGHVKLISLAYLTAGLLAGWSDEVTDTELCFWLDTLGLSYDNWDKEIYDVAGDLARDGIITLDEWEEYCEGILKNEARGAIAEYMEKHEGVEWVKG